MTELEQGDIILVLRYFRDGIKAQIKSLEKDFEAMDRTINVIARVENEELFQWAIDKTEEAKPK